MIARSFPFLALSVLAAAQEEKPTQAELEAAFSEQMTGAVLEGKFTDRTKPEADPATDRYTLGEVKKLESGKWRFESKIEYMGKEGTVPLEIDVFWAGDTPVITLTDFKVPLFGTFTARVMVFEDEYVGVWDGMGHGGKMWGNVIRAKKAEAEGEDEKQVNWHGFRGTNGDGYVPGESATKWNVEELENVRWRVPVPGLAHSSPVIHGDRLYLTSAVRKNGDSDLTVGLYGAVMPVEDEGPHEFRVMAFDKNTGEPLWDALAWEGVPEFKRHTKGSFAASSPATDGEYVLAFFGSEGLYAYTADGELAWKRTFGSLDSGWYEMRDAEWGFSSSPVIHGDKVIIQVDVQKDSFIAALELETGETIWRTTRMDVPTWSTPTVDVREGRSQVLINGWKQTGGYDLETGEPIWWLRGGGDIPVPRPIVAGNLFYFTSAHGRDNPLFAVPADAEGQYELTEESLVWLADRGNYMQTPLVAGDRIYSCRDNGILFCRDAKTGEQIYAERLGGSPTGYTASLVACGDKLYATAENGEIHVIPLGDEFEELAINDMEEECMATPAISEGVLYIRGRHYLTAIGK